MTEELTQPNAPFMVRRAMLCFAHRGASGHSPENTLLAFRYAFELGADAIECDVQLSADGAPVIIHDSTVDRTTNGKGIVVQLSLEQLRRLDAGAGEQIPELREVLALCREQRKLVNLEIKADTLEQAQRTAQVVGKVLETGGYHDLALVSSFWLPCLPSLKNAFPQVRTATLHSGARWRLLNMITAARAAGADALHPDVRLVSRALVEHAHAAGLQVNVWTIDQPKRMQRLASWGVDGIFTNYPERMLKP
ncbi:MAG TPA: glycerophosphodiester phosphodiesterase family protein [Ktedonobacterales bacterium]|nr:glycerophosphodiester phosphodiesterase family protein [Ktedonobacterales bacterium]